MGRRSTQKPWIKVYLTPFVPLSYIGEGEIRKRGEAPLRCSYCGFRQYLDTYLKR